MSRVATTADVLAIAVRAVGELHVLSLGRHQRMSVRRVTGWLLARASGGVYDRIGELLSCTGPTIVRDCRTLDEQIASGEETPLVAALVAAIGLLAESDAAEVVLPPRTHGGRYTGQRLPVIQQTPIMVRPTTTELPPIVERDGCPSTRPCPHTGCRHHLPSSCVLDVVALGPQSVDAIAGLLGLSDYHVWHIVERACKRANAVAEREGWSERNPQRRAHAWEAEDRDVSLQDVAAMRRRYNSLFGETAKRSSRSRAREREEG